MSIYFPINISLWLQLSKPFSHPALHQPNNFLLSLMLLSVLETSGEQTLLKAIYSANDISWHSPALYLSVQLTKQQTIWFSAPGRALCLSTKRIKKNPQTAVKLFIVNSSPFFWKARDVNKWPVWTHCFSNFLLRYSFSMTDHQFTLVLPEDITLTSYLKLKSCCLFSISSSAFFFLLIQKKLDLWNLWAQ